MPSLKKLIETELLPFVEKPMRYAGNECNIVKKNPASAAVHGVLCFPELYDIGMSHYGSQILYHIVNSSERWFLSRSYHPWLDAERVMREKRIPLFTLENFIPVREADFLGFSVQYELQYTNLVNMLDLAGLPLFARDRGEKDPLVMAGGPCMANPEPLADFVDVCVVGDGEEAVVSICEVIERAKQEGLAQRAVLARLADIRGVYVPSLYPAARHGMFMVPDMTGRVPVSAARVSALRDEYFPSRPLVPLMNVVHHRLGIEVMRGCTRGCRFCSAGTYYRPVRERTVDSIAAQMEAGAGATGWRDIGLLSLSTADYSGLDDLLAASERLRSERHLNISLPSTRIDALSTDQVAHLARAASLSSFTIAPEAGSQRLRDAINKDFTEERILQTAQTLLENNVQTLKLYFMIGLPTEAHEDIDALVECVSKIAGMARAQSRRRTVHVSISPFSPKPQTPFQWEAMAGLSGLSGKNAEIRKRLRHLRNVKVSYRNPSMTFLETVMARGDRNLSSLIHAAWKNGARFDGWTDIFSMDRWTSAAENLGIDMVRYTGEIPEDEPLPWSAVSLGIAGTFLSRERRRARQGKVTEDCRRGTCPGCGACALAARHLVASRPAHRVPADAGAARARRVEAQHTKHFFRCAYRKGEEVRFLSHRDMVAVFHRALSAAGVPIAYSEGYHPHPRVAFGPPLPLGIVGERELFDAALTAPAPPDPRTVNRWLPDGLCLETCTPHGEKPPSLNASVVAGRYVFVPHHPVTREAVRAAVDLVRNSRRLTVPVEKKGAVTEKDLRPLIHRIEYYMHESAVCIEAVLSMRGGSTCRPAELLRALFPDKRFSDFLVRRIECLADEQGKLVSLR
ncbi:MAG: TIGR03960 family B12-binding radical SAM protein [Chitinivibrionales bacterium]|nr:TIGR03960 family B12-binding radical SAM protein [Chitinivibrionales bacterium]MBD3396181.1 TIGR03960 family B12-binding radical SAM protein [Chitinivibrionales bacterium]